jgi:hypothetical protein
MNFERPSFSRTLPTTRFGYFSGCMGALANERRSMEDERKRLVSLADNSSHDSMCDARFAPFFINGAKWPLVAIVFIMKAILHSKNKRKYSGLDSRGFFGQWVHARSQNYSHENGVGGVLHGHPGAEQAVVAGPA